MSQCSIDGCLRSARSKGWCNGHYLRWWKTGDVMATAPFIEKGEPLAFIENVALKHQGDGCLKWPFSCDGSGYGKVWHEGRIERVSRLVCQRVNGPAPSPEHQAAHSCGKGHEACISPHHLVWKTGVENMADQVTHGTRRFGERSPVAKIKKTDVDRIFEMKAGGVKQREIADVIGISPAQVCRILKGTNWSASRMAA